MNPEHQSDRSGADEALDALVDAMLGATPRPVAWTRLAGRDAAAQWAVLDTWVHWLAARYTLEPRELPACWYRHPPLVEELSALRTAHQGAYDPGGPPGGPADWHHTLAAARARLRDWVARTGCRAGEHRDEHPADWTAEPAPEPYAAAYAAHVTADTAARDQTGVPPS